MDGIEQNKDFDGEAIDAADMFSNLADVSDLAVARRTPQEALSLVRNEVLSSEENPDSALFEFMSGAVADEEGIDQFEKVYSARTGKLAFRINGYGTLHDGKTLALAVSSFEDVNTVEELDRAGQKHLINLVGQYLAVIASGRYKEFPEGSEDRDIAEKVRKLFDACDSVRFIIMTDRHITKNVMSSGRKTQFERSMSVAFWGPMQYADAVSPDGTGENVDYVLSDILPDRGVLPFLETKTSDDEITTFVVSLPGYVLSDIYSTYGQKALEANVRGYLGKKGVNREISKTLETDPGMFHALNNGITLLASEVTKEIRGDMVGISAIKGLQIVNGGQTTAAMFFGSAAAKQKASVYCKIVVGESEGQPGFIKRVSTTSNSQSAIKKTDLTANELGNIEFERLSRSISVRGRQWYYERIRCQFENEKRLRTNDAVDLDRFMRRFDASRKITKTDVASVISLWDGYPHYVTAGAESNFTRWHKRTGGLPESIDESFFRKIVASIIVWRETSLITKPIFKDYNQAIVNYTVALIARHANTPEFFDAVWNAQGVSAELADKIKDLAVRVNSELREIAGDRAPSATSRMVATWSDMPNRVGDLDLSDIPEMY